MKVAKNWNAVFKKGHYKYKTPDLGVVKLVPMLKKKNVHKILDLGCGAGRHILYLAKKGFFVVGSDNSPEALKLSESLMKKNKIKNYSLVESDIISLPFSNGHFDAMISINVLHHNVMKKIKQGVKEIYRVLKKGGVVYVTIVSENDYKLYRGHSRIKKIGNRTYIVYGHREAGIVHHFFTEKEAKELFSKFKIIRLKELIIKSIDKVSKGRKHAHWEILAEKV